jgi:hypothetical protein
MTTRVDGTNGIVFPDGSTQGTAGVSSSSTQLCKAWVNFNGVTTATIRASYNVSSVTRNSTGNYTVNFTTSMTDANYSAQATAGNYNASNTGGRICTSSVNLAASYQFDIRSDSNGLTDMDNVTVAIFR